MSIIGDIVEEVVGDSDGETIGDIEIDIDLGGSGDGGDAVTDSGDEGDSESGSGNSVGGTIGNIEVDIDLGSSGGENNSVTDSGNEGNSGSNSGNGTGSDSNSNSNSNSNSSQGDSPKQYVFEVDGNRVTSMSELFNGTLRPLVIGENDTVVVEGDIIIHTTQTHFGDHITWYADSNKDGLHTRHSELCVVSDEISHKPHTIPAIIDILLYSSTDKDDLLAVREGDVSFGGLGADRFVVREVGHLKIGDFDSSQGDELVFDLGLGLTSLEHLVSFVTGVTYNNQDLVVSFGTEASVTLVGIDINNIGLNDIAVFS